MTSVSISAVPGKGARILLALAFVAAGGAKPAGVAPMVAIFDQIGIG